MAVSRAKRKAASAARGVRKVAGKPKKKKARKIGAAEAKARKALVHMSLEAWHIAMRYRELASRNADEQVRQRHEPRIEWFVREHDKALEEADLRRLDLTGQVYEVGMVADTENLEDMPKGAKLVVNETLEPTIMDAEGHVVHPGKVRVAERSDEK